MEWSDDAIIIGLTKYGEADAILDVLTREHGRARGFVRGGMGRRQRGVLQPGNGVHLTWRARVSTNLGAFTVECGAPRAAHLFADPARLAGMTGIAAILKTVMPEREPCPHVFDAVGALFDLLSDEESELVDCGMALVRFEAGLLSDQGFGLDLKSCAATGQTDDLSFVSPRSARAVSTGAAAPYKEKLLPLPGFMVGGRSASRADVADGLRLTAYFLRKYLLLPVDKDLPEARIRLSGYFEDRASLAARDAD